MKAGCKKTQWSIIHQNQNATIINLLPVLRHNHNHVDIETGIFLRFTMQIPKETGMQYIMSACLYINIEYELGEFVSQ